MSKDFRGAKDANDVIRPRWPSTIIVSERALYDAEILGRYFSCAEPTAQGKDLIDSDRKNGN